RVRRIRDDGILERAERRIVLADKLVLPSLQAADLGRDLPIIRDLPAPALDALSDLERLLVAALRGERVEQAEGGGGIGRLDAHRGAVFLLGAGGIALPQ